MRVRGILLILLVLVFGLEWGGPVWAIRYGSAGSVKNESEISVTVLIEDGNGDRQWVSLSKYTSYDLPEETVAVTVQPHWLDRDREGKKVQVILWHPDGTRVTITRFGQRVAIDREERRGPFFSNGKAE